MMLNGALQSPFWILFCSVLSFKLRHWNRAHTHKYASTHTHTHRDIYIYKFVDYVELKGTMSFLGKAIKIQIGKKYMEIFFFIR